MAAVHWERLIMSTSNKRETGATKFPAKTEADANEAFSQDAAENKPPEDGMGLTRAVDDVDDKTRQSDGQQRGGQATPSPATQKTSGAGPALAEHSKDAKAPKSGRQPGAYIKE